MKRLPFPTEAFTLEGHEAFLILPEARCADAAAPWVWYAPTLPKHPDQTEQWMFEQFLARGIAIAGIDVGESFGSPDGTARFSALYANLTVARDMSPTPVLLARSRGGLMLYNWAVENADAVAGIAGIYPVGDLRSYPGLEEAAPAHRLSPEDLSAQLHLRNPVERVEPLAAHQVPIHHIHGDRDAVVPIEANSGAIKARYDALGGTMTIDLVEGGGHDMSAHWFRSQSLVDFVIECAGATS